MSEASVIQVLTLNTAATFTTTTTINRVKIHNDSSFYLRVYFGLGAPSRPDSGGWHDTISPGASPVVAVVGAASAPVGRDFTNSLATGTYSGQIIIFPFLPTGAPLPAGGVVEGASLCYLTGYYPDEYAETAGQVEAFVQAAKQGRYQEAGPGSIVTSEMAFDNTTANGTATLIDSIGGSQSPVFLANVAGSSVINLYLFGWGGSLRNDNPNVATLDTRPTFVTTDSTGAVIRQIIGGDPGRIARATDFGCDSWWYAFPNPLLIQFAFSQGTLVSSDTIRYRFLTRGTPSGVFTGFLYFAFLVDKVNQTPLTAFPPNPPPPTVIANQPWNPVYNPQTY